MGDTSTGNEPARFAGHKGLVRAVEFAPDGKTAASWSEDETIQVLQLPR
jgi:WD40 repeat protein